MDNPQELLQALIIERDELNNKLRINMENMLNVDDGYKYWVVATVRHFKQIREYSNYLCAFEDVQQYNEDNGYGDIYTTRPDPIEANLDFARVYHISSKEALDAHLRRSTIRYELHEATHNNSFGVYTVEDIKGYQDELEATKDIEQPKLLCESNQNAAEIEYEQENSISS